MYIHVQSKSTMFVMYNVHVNLTDTNYRCTVNKLEVVVMKPEIQVTSFLPLDFLTELWAAPQQSIDGEL